MSRPHVAVVGGGLAGLAAALACADAGAAVTLLERRRRLGGLTWSFRHHDRWVDNGQHVFLRCCGAYQGFLERIGSAGDVVLQSRLDVTVLRPGARSGRIRRNGLPAPLHLAGSLAAYRHLRPIDRARLGPAALALRKIDLDNSDLDRVTFAAWLHDHGQSDEAIARLWNLITLATVNLPAEQASALLGAKVFQTGLLTRADAGDIGWSLLPLGVLHGERAGAALARAGAQVHTGQRVSAIRVTPAGFEICAPGLTITADSVIVALPHDQVGPIVPVGTLRDQDRLDRLGMSPIVNVHLTYDRPVTSLPMVGVIDSPAQWIYDRTVSSGMADAVPGGPGGSASAAGSGSVGGPASAAVQGSAAGTGSAGGPASAAGPVASGRGRGRGPQYLAVSVSGAGDLIGRRPDDLIDTMVRALGELLPAARNAKVIDSLVTREHTATFRATPGSAALRASARSRIPGLFLAGAWTDTGWPATMEGAVRSGLVAAGHAMERPARCDPAPQSSQSRSSIPTEVA